jgi:hypothetical protein
VRNGTSAEPTSPVAPVTATVMVSRVARRPEAGAGGGVAVEVGGGHGVA